MLITVTCKCGKQFRVDEGMAGETIHCMGCSKPVLVTKPGSKSITASRPAPPPAALTAEPPAYPPPADESAPEAEAPAVAPSARDYVYWVLAIAMFPLAVALGQPEKPPFPSRVQETLRDSHPETREKADRLLKGIDDGDIDDLFKLFPNQRLVGAAYPRDSSIHWLFGGVTVLVFAVVLGIGFSRGTVPVLHLVGIGLFTAVIGIGILFFIHMTPIGWFIHALEYSSMEDKASFGTVLVFFTLGVGLPEEACKAMILLIYLKGRPEIGWRQACLCGLATGVGFGVEEGLQYSSFIYHGMGDHLDYLVRFASCVTLHAIWSASAAVTLYHSQDLFHFMQAEGAKEEFRGDDLTDELLNKAGSIAARYGVVLLRMVAVVMVLHGLYDAALTADLNLVALFTALVSFAWLAWQIEACRRAEQGLAPAVEGAEA